MNAVLEKIQKLGIVPVVVLNDVADAELGGKSTLQRRPSGGGGDFPHGCGRRIHPDHEGEISGDAGGCGNCPDSGAGGACHRRRRRVYSKPRF